MKKHNTILKALARTFAAATLAFGLGFGVFGAGWDFESGSYSGVTPSGHTSVVSCTGGKLTVNVDRAGKGTSGCLYLYPTTSVTAETAPMLLYKANPSCAVKLYYKMSGDANFSETQTATSTVVGKANDGDTWHKIDLTAKPNYAGTVNGFMFAITSSDGNYAIDEIVFTADDEAYFNSIDGTSKGLADTVKSLSVASSASSITTAGGTLELTASAKNGAGNPVTLDAKAIHWETDDVCCETKVDENGKLLLTGRLNGTVNVTLTVEALGMTYKASKTITVSNQKDIIPATHFTYMSFGNSIWSHAQSTSIGWTADDGRGMAASALEKDYVHRFIYYIEDKFGEGTVEHIYGGTLATYERAIPQNDPSFDYSSSTYGLTGYIARVREVQPNLITVQMGENVSAGPTVETYTAAVKWFLSRLQEAAPNAEIILTTSFWGGDKIVAGAFKAGEDLGISVAAVHTLTKDDESNRINRAWGKFENSGVANHPGDTGMDNIAKLLYEQFNRDMTADCPTDYTVPPTAVTLLPEEGSITVPNGTLTLNASVLPADAPQTVVYTTSEPRIAEVSADGVVTAVNNGTVIITATSMYDESLYAECIVEVSGQTLPHTLSYDANTSDTVYGMPEDDEYAKDHYVLSTETYPTRDKYVFVGWSLTRDGKTVEAVDITEDTTVYAIWEYATRWDFDRTGDTMGFTGKDAFHFKTENGELSALATETDVAHGTQLTFISPVIELDAAKYNTLVLIMTNSVKPTSAMTLRVKTTSGTKTYNKEVTSTAKTVYVFDLAGISGSITGFEVVPTNVDCAVTIDSIAFSEGVSILYDKNTDDEVTDMPDVSFSSDVSESIPARAGYTFLGWSREADSKLLVGKTADGDTLPITLYAVWDKNDHFEFDENASFNRSADAQYTPSAETHTTFVTSTGNDPVLKPYASIFYPTDSVSGKMIIRMKADVASFAQVYYTTDLDSTPNEGKSAKATYTASDEMNDYLIDFTAVGGKPSASWSGNLNMLRFDLLSCPGNAEVAYIAFTDSERNIAVKPGKTASRGSDPTLSVLVAEDAVLAPEGVATFGALYLNGDIDYSNGIVRLESGAPYELNDDYIAFALCAADYDDVETDKVIDVGELLEVRVLDGKLYCNGVLLPIMDGTYIVPKHAEGNATYIADVYDCPVTLVAASYDADGRLVAVHTGYAAAGEAAKVRVDVKAAETLRVYTLNAETLSPLAKPDTVSVRLDQ